MPRLGLLLLSSEFNHPKPYKCMNPNTSYPVLRGSMQMDNHALFELIWRNHMSLSCFLLLPESTSLDRPKSTMTINCQAAPRCQQRELPEKTAKCSYSFWRLASFTNKHYDSSAGLLGPPVIDIRVWYTSHIIPIILYIKWYVDAQAVSLFHPLLLQAENSKRGRKQEHDPIPQHLTYKYHWTLFRQAW